MTGGMVVATGVITIGIVITLGMIMGVTGDGAMMSTAAGVEEDGDVLGSKLVSMSYTGCGYGRKIVAKRSHPLPLLIGTFLFTSLLFNTNIYGALWIYHHLAG